MAQFHRLPAVIAAICIIMTGSLLGGEGKRLESRVEVRGGVPTFIINGRPHTGACYSSYDCSPENLSRRVRQFSEAGCDVFNFVVEVSGYGFSRPMWAGKDRWDFSELDRRAHTILDAAPGAMLLPRIYIDAPEWWRDENPGEMMVLADGSTRYAAKHFALPRVGPFPSLASPKWRSDMKHALETVINHIERSEYGARVIGYQLSGQKTEEWYHWSMNNDLLGDYSIHMVRAFRDWLRRRYGTNEILRAAWQQPDVTINSAKIPSQAERYGDKTKTFRDPISERHVIDFHTFWSDIVVDTIAYFARVAKEKTSGHKIVGAFYAYTFEFADLAEDAGHLALGRLLCCPDVDFIMAPSSYYDRNLPGKPFFRAPVASINLHGKVFWNDFDQVSFRYFERLKADPKLKQWEYQMGLTKTAEEFVWMNRREVGMALAQGVQLAHFDIHGGYYEDSTIMRSVESLARIRQDSLQRKNRASTAEILIIVDEESLHYFGFRNPVARELLSRQIAEMGFVAPYDAILLSDLELADVNPYKLILVLNAVKLDDKQRSNLKRRLAVNRKTVVWLYTPGYFKTAGADPENMLDLTGIRVVADLDSRPCGEAWPLDSGFGENTKIQLPSGDQFRVDDDTATVLARRTDDTKKVVVAGRKFPHWTSVYSAAPLPADMVRRIAADAGVHLYTDRADFLVFGNARYLMLAAPEDGGGCNVLLPVERTVTDTATDTVFCQNARSFKASFRPKEARLFILE